MKTHLNKSLSALAISLFIPFTTFAYSSQIDSHVLKLALDGYHWALIHDPQSIRNKQTLTVIDFTKYSRDYRMWVINPNNDKVLMSLRVAQGKNSGLDYATQFSNAPRSLESSLGVYATASYTQYGHDGLELPLYGLEKGINNNAFNRAIIIHGAEYVAPEFIREHNRAGRSWGCFAVDPNQLKKLISLVKGGSVIFAYGQPENRDPNLRSFA